MTAAYLRELVDAWIAFDWRAREEWLDGHPQYVAEIDGARVHFVHQRSKTQGAPALLVMHCWPHTFALQLELAERLPDSDLVLPSFHGFVFPTPDLSSAVSGQRVSVRVELGSRSL